MIHTLKRQHTAQSVRDVVLARSSRKEQVWYRLSNFQIHEYGMQLKVNTNIRSLSS